MPYLLVQHNVSSYTNFESVFKADEARRRRFDARSARVFRSVAEPEKVFTLVEWDDAEKARKFADSYELREAMKWGGDPTAPQITVVEEVLEG
jgi:heme-degrading monooxygenase HmoA